MNVSSVRLPGRDTHLNFLGFAHHPFPMVPDASQYHLTPRLEALAHEILFAIQQRVGFIVLTGEVGLGKSTFCRYILAALSREDVSTSLVFNSYLQEEDLIEQILHDFGLPTGGSTVRERVDRLNAFFLSERMKNRNCVLFIDDAQNLTPRSLEYVRLLSNLETEQEKLVQVVLVGQPELKATLSAHNLRQLESRIALRRDFNPFSPMELEDYVRTKLERSSRDPKPGISSAALKRIAHSTRGNPRAMNLLLDRALLSMIARKRQAIGVAEVKAAERDLRPHAERPARTTRWPWVLLAAAILVAAVGLGAGYEETGVEPQRWFGRIARTPPPELAPPAVRAAPPAEEPAAQPPFEAPVMDYLERHAALSLADRLGTVFKAGAPSLANAFEALPNGHRLAVVPHSIVAAPGDARTIDVLAPDGQRWLLMVWPAGASPEQLEYGTVSPEIGALQARLQSLGYYWAAVDGKVGPMTLLAVAEFKRHAQLPSNYQLGNDTRLALDHPELFTGLQARRATQHAPAATNP